MKKLTLAQAFAGASLAFAVIVSSPGLALSSSPGDLGQWPPKVALDVPDDEAEVEAPAAQDPDEVSETQDARALGKEAGSGSSEGDGSSSGGAGGGSDSGNQ